MEAESAQIGDLIELAPGGRALRQQDLIHIVPRPSIAPLEGAGAAWVGLANLGGNLIPVADLGLLEGANPSTGTTMVAISAGACRFALLCEGVLRTRQSPSGDALSEDPAPGEPAWLLPSPPGEPRVIDPDLLLEDPRLGPEP
ncbi:MAG: chemotaxis protein CheW [Solirubrobacterales bacterium]